MSREGITDHLTARSISLVQLVYNQKHVSVYEGYFQGYHSAIKVLHSDDSFNLEELEKEFHMMLKIDHANVLRLYDCFWIDSQSTHYLAFVSEWCSKDLLKDVQDRKKNSYPFSEEELWKMIGVLISAFAHIQEVGLAHRDIKPANIFIGPSKELKIGDFGSATSLTQGWLKIVGTPPYLSPVLRAGLSFMSQYVQHNAFKSDVYSLGLTLYELASLTPPTAFNTPTLTQEESDQVVDSLFYSLNLKTLLKAMLVIDEAQRYDFVELKRMIFFSDQCSPESLMESDVPMIESGLETTSTFSNQKLKTYLETFNSGNPSQPQEDVISAAIPALSTSKTQKSSDPSIAQSDPSIVKSDPSIVQSGPSIVKSKPQCLLCHRKVNKFAEDALFEIVQLPCNPEKHLFCSRSCFAVWGFVQQKTNPHCPICGDLIPPDVFQSYNINEETQAEEDEKAAEIVSNRKSDVPLLEDSKADQDQPKPFAYGNQRDMTPQALYPQATDSQPTERDRGHESTSIFWCFPDCWPKFKNPDNH